MDQKNIRETGLLDGGARRDEVGGSGVYPASGPYSAGDAEFQGQSSWGQGVHGASGLNYTGRQLLGGYSAEDWRGQTLNVQIPSGDVFLEGDLKIPEDLRGIVLFAHGSGSSRHSPRNQYVARILQNSGIATLLFDLLTSEEEFRDRETGHLRFNIELLAKRLLQATSWIIQLPKIAEVKIGYFGASTGAAAALVAAGNAPQNISAVVSRGGRPDLAGPALNEVQAPTLLIVGGDDPRVVELNREALNELPGEKRLEIIPGATHLFEEAGTLEEAARLARQWFEWHLGRREDRIQVA
jgi:putative phosphoribosyl transferase